MTQLEVAEREQQMLSESTSNPLTASEVQLFSQGNPVFELHISAPLARFGHTFYYGDEETAKRVGSAMRAADPTSSVRLVKITHEEVEIP